MNRQPTLNSGFTMVEIVTVVLLFGILAAALIVSVPRYFVRQRDDQRKADLHNMKVAFEDYNNDKNCYPSSAQLQSCGSTTMAPYLKKVLCDPKTKQPYTYVITSDCQGYQIYTKLENTDDADIAMLGCDTGCGPGKAYNYGVVGGTSLLSR